MNIPSISSSAVNLLNSSQQKATEAAQTIAQASVKSDEVGGSKEFSSDELFKPVTSLKEAEIETQAAVKLLQADQDTKESQIDLFV